MALSRSLVEVILLMPEDGQLRVELRGELASILRLCVDGRQAARAVAGGLDDVVRQAKMFAGLD